MIKDEIIQEGTINYATIYPREILKRSLDLGAVAFILVHNHPSSDSSPSKEDIEITHKLLHLAANLDITLHDHIIVAKNGITSFKQLNLL
ncbi:DNA repair protein RadC domain protein [Candidatus Hepatincolaceae symbiont of Richtersius coronifer]